MTDSLGGSAIFHTFYPSIEIVTVADAIAAIETIHLEHGSNLPADLEQDDAVGLQFVRAHQTLGIPAAEFPDGHPQRQVVYGAYGCLMVGQPGSYARGYSFDESLFPASAWIVANCVV